jgi:hypothetical protein
MRNRNVKERQSFLQGERSPANGAGERLRGCNTLIALSFVGGADSIPDILLIHRRFALVRLGPACEQVGVAGNAADRKRTEKRTSRCHRGDAATEACKSRGSSKKRPARMLKEEARSAGLRRKPEDRAEPTFLQCPTQDRTPSGERKCGGTRSFGQREAHQRRLLQALGPEAEEATEPTEAERLRPEPVRKLEGMLRRLDADGRIGAGGDTGPYLRLGACAL